MSQTLAQKALIVFTLISFMGCSSTTIVRSIPSDAKIYLDDEYRGAGTATHTDTKIVGSSTRVKIVKDGCETFYTNFSRNEEFDAGACAGGVFTLVPFLWIMKYKPDHVYELNCKTAKEEEPKVEKKSKSHNKSAIQKQDGDEKSDN